MLGLLVWNSIRLINTSHSKLIESSTHEKSVLLAQSLVSGLVQNDKAYLLNRLRQLQAHAGSSKIFEDLIYLAIYKRNDQLIASIGKIPINRKIDHNFRQAIEDGVFDTRQDITLYSGKNNHQHYKLGYLRAGYSMTLAKQLVKNTRDQSTIIAVLSIIFTIFLAFIMGYTTTRYLRKLEQSVQALHRGDLQHRFNTTSRREFSGLAKTLNNLAHHLEVTQKKLKQNNKALAQEKKHLQTLLNGINAVVWEANPSTHQFTWVSREAENLLAYPLADWLESGFLEAHIHPGDAEWVIQEQQFVRNTPGSRRQDFRILDSQGRILWIREISNYEISESGEHRLRGLFLDVTDEVAFEERILFQAEHDSLTGLINRRRFQDELKHQIDYADRYGLSGALLFIDLDQFKYINDSYGHHTGDEFLIKIADRLQETLRQSDFLGRLGGDEFGIILPRANQEIATQFSSSLLRTLTETKINVREEHSLHVSASIGITLYPGNSLNHNDVLAEADTAMYAAKERGRNQYHIYHSEDRNVAVMQAKIHWEERIRDALNNDKFILHYQPIVDLETGETAHYEALLRMKNKNGELISPTEFLETAERFGLIRKIDHWVLASTIQAQGESMRTNKPIRIATNLSGRHFGQTEILELVKKAFQYYQADPASIIFEVTETAAVENMAEAQDFMLALRKLGCKFALDDFGIGFSSFYYLKNLPIDYIKIDGTFVKNLHKDQTDRIFVKAITTLAHNLNITTIAECIEDEEVLSLLQELGVDLGQGFFLGMPSAILDNSCFKSTPLLEDIN